MAVPAEAQWRGRYPHRHRDRIDGGDLLLGAILAGGIIALASSADKARRDRERDEDAPPPPAADAPVEKPGPYVGPEAPEGAASDGDDGAGSPVDVSDEDSAVDSCAAAAEDQARAIARLARVTTIGDVRASGNGWTVRGTIELSESYRQTAARRGFTCSVAQGGAPNVRIDGDRYSAR
jgi:hypothetical protein